MALRDSEDAIVLGVLTILTAEWLGSDPPACQCLDCGRTLDAQVLCPECAERRRLADRDQHSHRDACYYPESTLGDLCEDCRKLVGCTADSALS